jgi:hypothetical protein
MSYTVMCAVVLGPSKTGLTLQYRLFDPTGAYVGAAATAGLERGSTGTYLVPVVAPDGHQGGVDFLNASGGAILASGDWNPRELQNADILSSSIATGGLDLDALAGAVWGHTPRTITSGGPISVTAPVSADGTVLDLIIGEDYGPTPGNQPRLALTFAAGAWPDLTGGTAAFLISGAPASPYAGTLVTTGTGSQTVALDLTAA